MILAAALREGFARPAVPAGRSRPGQREEVRRPRSRQGARRRSSGLIREEIAAGFFNIDIDTSTLVDLVEADARRAAADQLRAGGRLRRVHPAARAGGRHHLGRRRDRRGGRQELRRPRAARLHGRVQRRAASAARRWSASARSAFRPARRTAASSAPDGKVRTDVKIDLDTLARTVGAVAREEYGLGRRRAARRLDAAAGRVRRLPESRRLRDPPRHRLPEHGLRPPAASRRPSRQEMYAWLREHAADERKPKDTEEQFLYKARKKAIGPFKRQMWSLALRGQGGHRRLAPGALCLPVRQAQRGRHRGGRGEARQGSRASHQPEGRNRGGRRHHLGLGAEGRRSRRLNHTGIPAAAAGGRRP